MPAGNPLRGMVVAVFGAYCAFVVAGLALYGMVDDSPLLALQRADLPLKLAWLAVEGGAALSALAFAVGAAPIALATLRRVFSQARRDLWLLAAPPLALLAALLVAGAVGYAILTAAGGPAHAPPAAVTAGAWIVAGVLLLAVAAGALAVVTLVRRLPPGDQTFRAPGVVVVVEPFTFALWPAAGVVAAMALTVAAVVAWGWQAESLRPALFNTTRDFPAGPPDVVAWALITSVMALATAVAGGAVARGFLARGDGAGLRLGAGERPR